MGFVIWHYVGRIGGVVLFPLAACAIIGDDGTPLHKVGVVGFCLLFALGITGAVLAVLLFCTRFRFACPECGSRGTEVSYSKKKGLRLDCADCGVTVREYGFLHLRLSAERSEKE